MKLLISFFLLATVALSSELEFKKEESQLTVLGYLLMLKESVLKDMGKQSLSDGVKVLYQDNKFLIDGTNVNLTKSEIEEFECRIINNMPTQEKNCTSFVDSNSTKEIKNNFSKFLK